MREEGYPRDMDGFMTRSVPSRSLIALALLAGCGGTSQHVPLATIASSDPVAVVAVDPHLIEMIAEPAASLVTADGPGHTAVRVRISGGTLYDAKRPQLNLALVMDTSGSLQALMGNTTTSP
jgi:hypothetical protein